MLPSDANMNNPTDQDVQLARDAVRALDKYPNGDVTLRLQVTEADKAVATMVLPLAAIAPLQAILRAIGDRQRVTVHASDADLTVAQAADLLHVSQSFLLDMIENGVLPAHGVDTQRRLPLKDVLAYRRDNEVKRRLALEELARLDQELGLR
jgi:excisionase family DNA binding protein